MPGNEADFEVHRKRRSGLYQFMTPDDYEESESIRSLDICTALQEHTTCTGLPHIHHARGPIKKAWWTIITLGAIAGLIYNLWTLGSNYASFSVNVVIQMKHENQLTFPSVTVCNMSPIRRSLYSQYLQNGTIRSTTNKRRRKRAASSDVTTSSPNYGSTSALFANNCCCSCCFSSADLSRGLNCSCDAGQFPYDPSSCPALHTNPAVATTTTPTTKTPLTTTMTTTKPTTESSRATTVETTTESTTPRATTSLSSAAVTTTKTVPTTTTESSTTTLSLVDQMLESGNLVEILASMNRSEKQALGFSASELILDCMFEGAECQVSKFETFFNEILGNCYIFNGGWDVNQPLNKAMKTGRRHGLQMILNVDQADYVTQGDDMAGIRMVVHEQGSMPFPEDEGLALNPGQSTSIGLRQVNVLRASPPYDTCVNPTISNININVYEELYPGVNYSTTACMRTCYQMNVIQTCGCGDPSYPLIGTAFGSNTNPAPPCRQQNSTQQLCMANVGAMYNQNQINCNCPEACSDTEYTTTLSIGEWPSNVQKNDILSKFQPLLTFNATTGYKDNLVKVEVFYEDFSFEMIQEVPGYLFPQFLSDSGGVLGLWLGMSVLTICEFFEFGLDMSFLGVASLLGCMQKKNKVETLNLPPPPPNVRQDSDMPSRPPSNIDSNSLTGLNLVD